MRKISLTIFSLAFVIFISTSALAANTYNLPDLELELTIPSGYSIITRDTPADDPVFSELGTTKSAVISNFQANNIYLNALANSSNDEIVVVMTESALIDFNLFSDTMIDALASSLIDQLSDWGIIATKYDVYKHSQTRFLRVFFAFSDNSVHGVQYYTIYDGKSMNFTLRSYSGALSSTQERKLKTLVDSISFDSVPLTPTPEKETEAFIYTDKDTGISFTVPANWKQEPLSKDREVLDTRFVSSKQDACMMLYGSTDIWSEMPDSEKTGLSRADINGSFLTADDIASAFGASAKDVSVVTYNGVQYFKIEVATTASLGIDISVTMTQLAHVNNGWMYLFQFGGTDSHKLYADFESLMKSVQYPDNSAIIADSPSVFQLLTTDKIVISAIALLLISVIIVVVVTKRAKNLDLEATSYYTLHDDASNPIHSPTISTSIYCRKCGQELPADSMFCHICGTIIIKEEQ